MTTTNSQGWMEVKGWRQCANKGAVLLLPVSQDATLNGNDVPMGGGRSSGAWWF